jgi:hypothetical protein
MESDHAACFHILLKYYDKWYNKGLQNREIPGELLNKYLTQKWMQMQ